MRSRARSLRRKNSPRPSQPLEKRELCCTKEREAGKILSSMSPGTKATTISRSGSETRRRQIREPRAARPREERPPLACGQRHENGPTGPPSVTGRARGPKLVDQV